MCLASLVQQGLREVCFSKLHKPLLAHQVCTYGVMNAQGEFFFPPKLYQGGPLCFNHPSPHLGPLFLLTSNYSPFMADRSGVCFFLTQENIFLYIKVSLKITTNILRIEDSCRRAEKRTQPGCAVQ